MIPALLGLAVVIAAFGAVVATRPGSFVVTRSATIFAPPDRVFPHVNSLRSWTAWSPWEKLDPALKREFEGPESGPGAIYRWQGNKNVGVGSMTISDSQPSELVRIKLEFLKPFAATNDVQFKFEPDGNKTRVTWSMTGNNNFMAKAMHMFMNIDKMVGGQFEKGLANLKSVAETAG